MGDRVKRVNEVGRIPIPYSLVLDEIKVSGRTGSKISSLPVGP